MRHASRFRHVGVWSGWAVVLAAIAALLVVAMTQQGCSSGEDGPDPQGNACGVADQIPAMDCTSVKQCGAGAQNYAEVTFCEHCFARSDTAFCEAGTCRTFDPELTNVEVNFNLPPAAVGVAKSFAIASLVPTMADGAKITCASLMKAGCEYRNNAAINARNSRFNNLAGGDFFRGLMSIDPGNDRLLFIQLTDDVQGKGNVLATGCLEGIDVVKGPTPMAVSVELH